MTSALPQTAASFNNCLTLDLDCLTRIRWPAVQHWGLSCWQIYPATDKWNVIIEASCRHPHVSSVATGGCEGSWKADSFTNLRHWPPDQSQQVNYLARSTYCFVRLSVESSIFQFLFYAEPLVETQTKDWIFSPATFAILLCIKKNGCERETALELRALGQLLPTLLWRIPRVRKRNLGAHLLLLLMLLQLLLLLRCAFEIAVSIVPLSLR